MPFWKEKNNLKDVLDNMSECMCNISVVHIVFFIQDLLHANDQC